MAIIKNKLKRDFTIMPNYPISDPDLSHGAFRVLVYLFSKPDEWKVNNSDIMKKLGIKQRSTIASYLAELVSKGMVTRTRKRENGKYVGGFEYDLSMEKPKVGKNHNMKKPKVGKNHNMKKPKVGKNHTHNKTDSINNTDREQECAKQSFARSFALSFDTFWDLYSYKRNKKKAKRLFDNLSDEKKKLCIDTTPIYLNWLKCADIPQMLPSTWIEDERWDDDFTRWG